MATSLNKRKKSWREKLADNKGFPKVCRIDSTKSKNWGRGTFVIPSPMEVNELMLQVPKGKLTTIGQLRNVLAQRHGATIACPITTGIFAWISAHAAAEAMKDGAQNTTPYWRTLKANGQLNAKYPGGIAGLKRKLATEGHRVVRKGKNFFVHDLQERLFVFDTGLDEIKWPATHLHRQWRRVGRHEKQRDDLAIREATPGQQNPVRRGPSCARVRQSSAPAPMARA